MVSAFDSSSGRLWVRVPRKSIIVARSNKVSFVSFSLFQPEKGTRTIYHYQFIAWPEHGLPENVGSILGILHDINLKQKDYDYPIVVQCRCVLFEIYALCKEDQKTFSVFSSLILENWSCFMFIPLS